MKYSQAAMQDIATANPMRASLAQSVQYSTRLRTTDHLTSQTVKFAISVILSIHTELYRKKLSL